MGQSFLLVFKKLLWNGRDESQLPGDHQSCLVGHVEPLTLAHTVHMSIFSWTKSTIIWTKVMKSCFFKCALVT